MDMKHWKVAICEDNPAQQRYIKQLVYEWGNTRGLDLEISVYQNCESCWFSWEERMDWDLLFLDIDLGQNGMNGMELARRIREKDSRAVIIFITALPEYMSEGYDVEAFHFLIKPVDAGRLSRILDRAFYAVKQNEESYLFLESDGNIRLIPIDIIVCAEAFSHTVRLYLCPQEQGPAAKEMPPEQTNARMGLGELESRLPAGAFFRCHRSYLISLAHIRKIEKKQVFLEYGVTAPVGRTQERALYQAFLAYHRQKGDLR
jgi:DNA-binding LytR/AlgR family response regulator